MPTAFITAWDGYTNHSKQLYLPINFTQWHPPAGEPVVLHAYTAQVVHQSVFPHLFDSMNGEAVDDWEIMNVWKPDDEHLVVGLRHKVNHGRIKSYAVRWHY